jgi:hypothetical protein
MSPCPERASFALDQNYALWPGGLIRVNRFNLLSFRQLVWFHASSVFIYENQREAAWNNN